MCLARHSSTQKLNAADLSAKYKPGKSVRGRRELKYVQILSQNTQGFNEDKEEIILALMQQKNIFAYATLLHKKPGGLGMKFRKSTATTNEEQSENIQRFYAK